MTDETPAPERPREEVPAPERPDRFTPPPARYEEGTSVPTGPAQDGAPPPAGSPWEGVRVLLMIFGGMALLEALLYVTSRYFEGPGYGETFGSSQTLIWLFGLVALVVMAVRLPPRSRTGLLSGCAIAIGVGFTILMVTCGIALMNA